MESLSAGATQQDPVLNSKDQEFSEKGGGSINNKLRTQETEHPPLRLSVLAPIGRAWDWEHKQGSLLDLNLMEIVLPPNVFWEMTPWTHTIA